MNPCRIMVVEDEVIVAMDIEDRLAAMGYGLAGRATSGQQALALVEEKRPDLVLMDIRLQQVMDGVAAAEEIRRRFHLPVIFLTAYSEDATLDRAKLAEPYGYLLKPFDDRELKSVIEIALYKHRAEEEIRRLNRLYDVLSQVNQAVVRASSREDLLQTVCRLMVERGAIDLAWIASSDSETGRINTVACFGSNREILSEAELDTGDRPEWLGNPDRAIREGESFICNECVRHDCLYPPLHAPAHYGFQSCGSFPIRFQGQVCGALTLCVKEPGFFREREIGLLEEVALDVSFALDKIEGEARRMRAEAALRESEERFRLAMEATSDGLWDWDVPSGEVYYSPGYFRMLGYEPGEWPATADTFFELIHPDDRQRAMVVNDACIRNESPSVHIEVRMRSRDGSWRWILGRGKAVRRDGEGRALQMVGTHVDITEHMLAEEALKHRLELQDQLSKISASVPGAVYSFRLRPDGSACIPFATPAIEDLLGIPMDLLARDASYLYANVHPDDLQSVKDTVMESARIPSPWHDQYRYLHPTKGLRWIEGRSMPQAEPDGGVVWHGFVMDITERKLLEEERFRIEAQLRQAQKMEALGTLAGGIAHDFNNILGIIIGYSEIALLDVLEEAPMASDLQEVIKAANRAKDLVQQILAFSRLKEQERKPVQVGLIVKEAMKMLRASLPSTIDITLGIDSKGIVMGDPTQIHQVLMNLCTNAGHAMREEGGVLEVTLADRRLGPESLSLHSTLKPGAYVELTVKDTGHGMDSSIVERIFDPFFTTKDAGVGTGLGLSVVHGIVRNHGGAIEVESCPGKGTTFQVLFPAMVRAQTQESVASVSLAGGRERILVVDDEPSLAQATKQILERLGYEVDCRTNGLEALEVFRQQHREKPYDLVITDMTMPQLTGADLARELLGLQPDLPILLCTGFNETINPEKAKSLGIQGVLMKPVAVRDLAGLIRDVLDGKGESVVRDDVPHGEDRPAR